MKTLEIGKLKFPFSALRAYLARSFFGSLLILCLPLSVTLVPSKGFTSEPGFDAGLAAARQGEYGLALQAWQPLAEQGLAKAQYGLGLLHVRGHGVPQSEIETAGWFRKAAEQGHVDAQLKLGFLYQSGQGVTQDTAEAARWYQRAAEQGDPDAQYNLGRLYSLGSGVAQDDEKAARLIQKSAKQGDADAQYVLGQLYHQGVGVTQDHVTAHIWLSIAADNGLAQSSRQRDELSARMAAAELSEAQRRAHVCMSSEYQDCD